jgi:hypothetical protein
VIPNVVLITLGITQKGSSPIQLAKRNFSSTSKLLNNTEEDSKEITDVKDPKDMSNNWKDYTYKLYPQNKVTSSILNQALLSFFGEILTDVSKDRLILLNFRIKLSNNTEIYIINLRFYKKGVSMFHKIFYLLNYNLKLKNIFPSEANKGLKHLEIIFQYKIKN